MFKIVAICSLSVLLMIKSAFAFDSSARPYVGVIAGSAITSVNKVSDSSGSLNTDFNPGYLVGFTAGMDFKIDLGLNIQRIRAEAEVGYRSSDLVSMNTQGQSAKINGTVSVTNLMINCYLENTIMLPNDLPINLFLTAGVGGARASISSVSFQGTTLIKSANDTQLAYQGGLGAGYEFTKNITLDAAYKYMGTTTFKLAGVNAEYGSHNVLLGARYSFN